MKTVRNVCSGMLAIMLTLMGMVGYIQPTFAEGTSEMVEINILHTNDTHGRVKTDKDVIGIDTLATIKKAMTNPILVDAGDTLHGLPFATMKKGEDIVTLMNLAGYDFMTTGNHDYNYGYDRLLELKGKAKFPILGANVTKNGKNDLESNSMKEIEGVKVGFFGLASPETAYKTNPNNVKGVTFADPIETAKKEVKALQEQGADVIVALAHIGLDKSTDITSDEIAAAVDGIDVIIDGHSHTTLPTGEEVNDTLIASTGNYLGNVGHVTLTVDKATKEVKAQAKLISKAEANTYGTDAIVQGKIDEINKEQDVILSVKVGHTDVDLDGVRDNVRRKETNLGNLLTDAMIAETGADLAITNGGGIRDSIAAGDITKGQVIKVLPFGNYIVTKKLTGKEMKAVLEHGVKDYPNAAGQFPHVAGLSFMFDAEKPAGERVVNMTIDGKAIDMEKEYVVATNDFLAVGGDEYPSFGDKPTENEFSSLEEALGNYIAKNGTVSPAVEGRITVGKGPDFDAQRVMDMINALPKTITLRHIELVESIYDAYNKLSEEQKAYVTNFNQLEAAEEQIMVSIESVFEVMDKIESLPKEITLKDKALVEKARVAYDALTEDQKEFVENYEKLVDAEKKITQLEKPVTPPIDGEDTSKPGVDTPNPDAGTKPPTTDTDNGNTVKPEGEKNPNTGDNSNMPLYSALFLIAAGGVYGLRKMKKSA